MIGIELVVKTKTETTNTFIIDVVNRRLKRIHDGEKEIAEPKWWPYGEIQGQGNTGENLIILWRDGKTSKSLPVVSKAFKKI